MTRRALVVGGDQPAGALADGLTELEVIRADIEPAEVDDHTVDQLLGSRTGLDLVVHALYPSTTRAALPLVDMSAESWRRACDQPLAAAARIARGAHPHLATRRGTMVFVVPRLAALGEAHQTAFATVAEAMRVLARSLARSWGRDGIRVQSIVLAPTAFELPGTAAATGRPPSLHRPALGRTPDIETEVAVVVDRLSRPEFAPVTGASIALDGGVLMTG